MTATEWLIEQLIKYKLVDKTINPDNVIFHKAKEMEKQQLQKAIKFENERMYSEEDMIDFAMFYYTHQGKATKYWGKDLFKEWFEQFKKK